MDKNYIFLKRGDGALWMHLGALSVLLMFLSLLPSGVYAQTSPPNCVHLNLSVGPDDSSRVTIGEIVPNISVSAPVTVVVEGEFGNTIFSGSGLSADTEIPLAACRYQNATLRVTVTNSLGRCWSELTFKSTDAYNLVSNLDTMLWCIDPLIALDANDFYELGWYTTSYPFTLLPIAYVPCRADKVLTQLTDINKDGVINTRDARDWYAPRFEECSYRAIDWTQAYDCNDGDTAKIIIREWEAYNSKGTRSTVSDTIRVIKLPDLSEDGYIHAPQKDTVVCALKTVTTKKTKPTMLCWKQLVGLHSDGSYVYYPKSYVDDILSAVTDAVGIAELQSIDVIFDRSANRYYNLYEIAAFATGPGPYGETAYLFKVAAGDRIMTNGGDYLTVDENWFYQADEHGFWIDLCIPSVEVCVWEEVCDVWPEWECENGVQVILPNHPYAPDTCKLYCLSNDLLNYSKCFTSLHAESKELGYSCPRAVKKNFTVKQLCYATNTATLGNVSCSIEADESGIIASSDDDNPYGGGIAVEQWKLYMDTIGPLYIDEYGYDNVFRWSAGTHDCLAEVTIPKIKVKDDCSGVKYVKAKLPGQGWTNLMLDDEGYWVHPAYARTYQMTCGVYEVTYELVDNCHNVRTISPTYVKIVDVQAPSVITDDNIRVSLGGKTVWVDSEKFDAGSTDNCGIRMILARRADWKEGCGVNLCNAVVSQFETEEDMDDYIDRYGLTSVLEDGDIEEFYADSYEWLKYDGQWCNTDYYDHYYNQYDNTSHYGDCENSSTRTYTRESNTVGNYVLEGWEYDIKSYWASVCASDDHGQPIKIKENQLASIVGGGWGQKVPFCCEDACKEVVIEVLAIDKECNYSKGWLTVTVEDKSAITPVCYFDEITLSCGSYTDLYKDAIDAAISAGNNSVEAEEEFKAVDDLLGDLVKGWRGADGETLVDDDGNTLSKKFTYRTSECKYDVVWKEVPVEEHDGTISYEVVYDTTIVLEEVEKEADKGGVAILCGVRCEQDIWTNLNDCGLGTVTRRWRVSSCAGHTEPIEFEQVIKVVSGCELNKLMFEIPQDTAICLDKLVYDGRGNLVANTGELSYMVEDIECRQLGYGYDDELFVLAGETDKYKLHRNWTISDWCAGEEIECVQEVVIEIGDCGTDTSSSRAVVTGTIETSYDGGKIQKVNVRGLANGSEEHIVETAEEGAFTFDVSSGSSLTITPEKDINPINGVNVGDIIDIQRHILQVALIDDQYRMVAADVNRDGLINVKDVVAIRQLSLEKATEFPNNTSWRFFSEETNDEVFEISSSVGEMEVNFIGVKIGDVDNQEVNLARNSGLVEFRTEDIALSSGESYSIQLNAEESLSGYQFALRYNPELVSLTSVNGANLTASNWNIVRPGELRISYDGDQGQTIGVELVALASTDLSKALTIGDVNQFSALAVTEDNERRNVGLAYNAESKFTLYQNEPNPVNGFTTIAFSLPEATNATLTFFDLSGKQLKVINNDYNKGLNKVAISTAELGVTGVVCYQIETETQTATKRMVLLD